MTAQEGAGGRSPKLLGGAVRRGLGVVERLVFPTDESSDKHWQRVVMNEAVNDHIDSLDPPACTAAEIAGDAHADRPWKSYCSLGLPQFDLCAPLEADRRFDVVICEQVLEHVVDPCAAAANLRALCAPGGHVIVTTPFLVKVHELPTWEMYDYWRFSPRGLLTLLEHVGLVVDTVGSWGNRLCLLANLSGWAGYRRWQSLRNDPDVPLQVWAFAQNPR